MNVDCVFIMVESKSLVCCFSMDGGLDVDGAAVIVFCDVMPLIFVSIFGVAIVTELLPCGLMTECEQTGLLSDATNDFLTRLTVSFLMQHITNLCTVRSHRHQNLYKSTLNPTVRYIQNAPNPILMTVNQNHRTKDNISMTRKANNYNDNNSNMQQPMLDKFICNDFNTKQWKIYKEAYHSSLNNRSYQTMVFGFVTPNCSINGYASKWNCSCRICENKMPWFWESGTK